MTTFVDRVYLHVAAGSGGHGGASIHRDKSKPLGGPHGGNGGRGGGVILVVDQEVTTLLDYHHSPHRKATNGAPGAGDNRSGKDGQAGARSDDGVAIGPEENAVVFDWAPTMMAGAEMLGRRGEDHRLLAPRPAAQRRRESRRSATRHSSSTSLNGRSRNPGSPTRNRNSTRPTARRSLSRVLLADPATEPAARTERP